MHEFSKLRNDTYVVKSSDVVHHDCQVLRSQEQFKYREKSNFCGQFADVKDKRKNTNVFPVRTKKKSDQYGENLL